MTPDGDAKFGEIGIACSLEIMKFLLVPYGQFGWKVGIQENVPFCSF